MYPKFAIRTRVADRRSNVATEQTKMDNNTPMMVTDCGRISRVTKGSPVGMYGEFGFPPYNRAYQ